MKNYKQYSKYVKNWGGIMSEEEKDLINLKLSISPEKYMEELQQENHELKKENKILRENAENNDKVVDKVNWENMLLKKQLEDANEKILLLQASEPMLNYKKALEETQQKEFIKYLEDYIKEMEEEIGNSITEPYKKSHIIRRNVYQEILQKYRSIIGCDKVE